MSATGRGGPARSATADREIVISRVIDAPRELVFEAEDFGEAYTPELRERDERLRAQAEKSQ